MNPWWKNNFFPAVAWGAYHVFLRSHQLTPLGGLFALRGILVFLVLVIRHQPIKRSPSYQIIIAWASTLLPTQLIWVHSGGTASVIGMAFIILGSLLVGISIIDLGKSFGISPALRPFVANGIYRHIRNPMYLGHVLGETGIILTNPSATNMVIVIGCWSLYALRASWERQLFESNADLVIPSNERCLAASRASLECEGSFAMDSYAGKLHSHPIAFPPQSYVFPQRSQLRRPEDRSPR